MYRSLSLTIGGFFVVLVAASTAVEAGKTADCAKVSTPLEQVGNATNEFRVKAGVSYLLQVFGERKAPPEVIGEGASIRFANVGPHFILSFSRDAGGKEIGVRVQCATGLQTLWFEVEPDKDDSVPKSMNLQLVGNNVEQESDLNLFYRVKAGTCFELRAEVEFESGKIRDVTSDPGTAIRVNALNPSEVRVKRPGTVCLNKTSGEDVMSIGVSYKEVFAGVFVKIERE